MENKNVLILIHVLCCLIFLLVPAFTLPPEYDNINAALLSLPYLRDMVGYLLTIGFFYLSYFYLIPEFYFRKKYFLFFAFGLLGYLLNTALPNLLNFIYTDVPPHSALQHMTPGRPPMGPPHDHDHHQRDVIAHLTHNFLRFAVVFFIALLLKINEQYKKMKKEKIEAELAYLKTQINPHFLFNTLNTIYSLAVEQSRETADAVVKLSGMMRYVLKETTKDYIPLDVELEYIASYIDLQKNRFDDTVKLSYTVSGDPSGKRIAPLLLIPFVENTFKHGINPEADSVVNISIVVSGDELHMSVVNNIVPVQSEEPGSGIGIENTRARLAMLYPAAHKLSVTGQNGIFIVDLNLHLS